jgi:hypothetical protein
VTEHAIGRAGAPVAEVDTIPISSVDAHWLMDNPAETDALATQLRARPGAYRAVEHPTGTSIDVRAHAIAGHTPAPAGMAGHHRGSHRRRGGAVMNATIDAAYRFRYAADELGQLCTQAVSDAPADAVRLAVLCHLAAPSTPAQQLAGTLGVDLDVVRRAYRHCREKSAQ